MENKLSIITKESTFGQIRFVFIDERVYAVAYDVLKATGYSEGALRTVSSKKCKRFKRIRMYKFNGSEVNFVDLVGIIRLAAISKLPELEKIKFEDWAFDEASLQIEETYRILRKKLGIHYTELNF